jgi:lysophospholipase L1-like esterase
MNASNKSIIPKQTLRNFAKNFLLLLVTIVLIMGALEISLRIYNPLGFRIKGNKILLPRNKKEVIYHDKSVHKFDPVVVCTRNSLGFRGAEPPPDFAQRLTILVIGGSTTECLELADNKTWAALLGFKLDQDFKRFWLNNAGLGGHSTFGHLVLIKDYVAKLRPKVAVFLVGINDVGTGNPREFDTRLKALNFRSLDKFLDYLANYSELAAASVNMYRHFFPKATMAKAYDSMGEQDFRKMKHLETPEADRTALKQLHRSRYLKAYEARLIELIKICRANNIEPVFVTQPMLYGNVIDDVTGINLARIKVTNKMDGETAWEVLELYNDTTKAVGKREGVLVIDAARELPKSSRYFADMIHFSNAGAQALAQIVYAGLEPHLAREYPGYLAPRGAAGRTSAGPSAAVAAQ